MPKYYYASVINGEQKGLLMGPFDTHDEAEAAVPEAKRLAAKADSWAHLYSYGTAGSDELLPVVFPH